MATKIICELPLTLDTKNRVMLPVSLRKKLSEEDGNLFVFRPGLGNFVNLYTKTQWDLEQAKIDSLNYDDEEEKELKSFLSTGVHMIESDAAGRLIIPQKCIEYAGLHKNIILHGLSEVMELWNEEAFNEKKQGVDIARMRMLSSKFLKKNKNVE